MASCPASSSPTSGSEVASEDCAVVAALQRVRDYVEPWIDRALAPCPESSPRLVEAMRYAALAPGKRLRPALVLWAAQACGGAWDSAAPAAVAVELVHAYSLVHDDLPAMDDDDLRRGRPTCHRAFDEATAILCGDALQALAFETLARGMPAGTAAEACATLARASGVAALVGGQADDLAAERGWVPDLATAPAREQLAWMERINRRKTGALFLAALDLGGLAAGADAATRDTLGRYGRSFGQAFQIADDLLDAEGDEVAVGKRVGKDAGRGKLTFPTVEGIPAARERAERLGREAAEAAAGLGPNAADLGRLASWIVTRRH
jgi:geranylgeranyl diphosphate synthase type II